MRLASLPEFRSARRAILLRTASRLALIAFGFLGATSQASASGWTFPFFGATDQARPSGKTLSQSYRPTILPDVVASSGSGDSSCILPATHFDPNPPVDPLNPACDTGFIRNQDGLCIRRENVCGAGLPGHRLSQSGALTIGRATLGALALRDGIETRLQTQRDPRPPEVSAAVLNSVATDATVDSGGHQDRLVSVWGQAHGLRSTLDSHDDANFKADATGALLGIDVQVDSRTLFGIAIDSNRLDVDSQGGDVADLRYKHVALYAGHTWSRAFVNAMVFIGGSKGHTHGVVDPDPFTAGIANGEVSGSHTGVSLSGGYRLDTSFGVIEPLAELYFLRASQDAYTQKTFYGYADQAFGAVDADVSRASIAGRYSNQVWLDQDMILRVHAELGWAYWDGDDASITTEAWGFAPTALTPSVGSHNALLGQVGARLNLGPNTELILDAHREDRGAQTTTGVALGGKVRF